MSDLQHRRQLAKLTKPQLIELLIHAEQLIAPSARPDTEPEATS